MSPFLYKDFLENRRTYFSLRAFWVRRLRRLLPQGERFETYASEKFQDGTYFFDGNPIVSMINWSTLRGVRIVQLSPEEFGLYYSSGENEIALQRTEGQYVQVVEKIISLTLTRESYSLAVKEIEDWLS